MPKQAASCSTLRVFTTPLTPRPAGFRCLLGALIALMMAGWAQAGTDAESSRQFRERRERLMGAAIAVLDEQDPAKGSFLDVAAALQRGQNLAVARKRLTVLDERRPTGNMAWTYPIMAVLLNGDEHLDEANRARIGDWWQTYWPSCGDTESHWVMYYASLYLAAQHYPRSGPARWFNGQSAAENLAESRSYLEHWMKVASSPHTTILRLAQSATDARPWIVGTQLHGAWRSRDGGATWSDRSAGLPTKHIFVLTFDSEVKGRLWASAFEEGTFYPDDFGLTWLDGGLHGAYGFDYFFVPVARC